MFKMNAPLPQGLQDSFAVLGVLRANVTEPHKITGQKYNGLPYYIGRP